MADLERFGAELTLNATQFISTVGQVERANVRLEQTLKATGTAINDLGVKFDKSFKGAERFGTLIDTSTGRVRKGLDLLNEKIDQSVNKHAQLAESGSASHRKLAQSLEKLNTAENTYVNALENVRKAIIKQAEAGKDDLEAKEKVNKAVRTAQNVYRSYQKALQQVNTQQAKINRENNAVIASYQILGRRLAQTNTFWNRMSATVQNVVSKFAPLQRALSTIRAGLTGAGSGAAGTAGLLGVLGKAAGAAGIALGVVVKAVSLAGGAFKALLSPLTRAISAFKNFFRIASQIAVGILIRDTIRGIVRELRELAFAGFEAVKFFQALEIRLDLMELRALRAEGAVGSLGDMMGRASERAQLLLQWIKELSLVSPFTVETLATTTSLNLAMGFTEDMAKRLTIAIAEYTAGMGLSNQVMERIVFNFGQMKAAGKVTATEMRDLARGAFLPLTDVLDEAARLMNVTTDDIMEFRKAAAEGAVSVDTFFQAFINVVDRDFAGASERFSRTLDGVRNRLANFIKTVLGLEVLGPIAARFAEIASNALDKIMQPEIIGRAKLLGETIVRAFDLIRNKAQALSISLGHLW
ncbi:MAG: tape measure protein, partial [Planctomycetota bacterium]